MHLRDRLIFFICKGMLKLMWLLKGESSSSSSTTNSAKNIEATESSDSYCTFTIKMSRKQFDDLQITKERTGLFDNKILFEEAISVYQHIIDKIYSNHLCGQVDMTNKEFSDFRCPGINNAVKTYNEENNK